LHKQRRDTDDSEGSFIEVLREYDKQVGRFMAGLKQLGLDEKTIVVFSSDNGPAPDFDNTRCGGLRGRKASLYEGGSREPFIVRWTDKTPAGRIDDKTVIDAVDLFPTFCKLAGASLPRNAHLDGADVSKSFFGQNIERATPLFWEFGGRKGSGRPPGKNVSPNVAVREGKWKLLINDDGSALELYDLDADQNETNNVAEQNPTIAKRLSASALRWRKQQP
jgi:arylsulfatase A-like enzyme